jgi:hypothetical protein
MFIQNKIKGKGKDGVFPVQNKVPCHENVSFKLRSSGLWCYVTSVSEDLAASIFRSQWRRKQRGPLKCWYPTATLQSVTTKISTQIFTVMNISNLTSRHIPCLIKNYTMKYGGTEVWFHAFLILVLNGGQWSASCPRERTSGTHWIGDWEDCRTNLDSMVEGKKSLPCSCQELKPGHLSHSLITILTGLSWHSKYECLIICS